MNWIYLIGFRFIQRERRDFDSILHNIFESPHIHCPCDSILIRIRVWKVGARFHRGSLQKSNRSPKDTHRCWNNRHRSTHRCWCRECCKWCTLDIHFQQATVLPASSARRLHPTAWCSNNQHCGCKCCYRCCNRNLRRLNSRNTFLVSLDCILDLQCCCIHIHCCSQSSHSWCQCHRSIQ